MALTGTPKSTGVPVGTFKESAVGTGGTKNIRNGATELVAVDMAETGNANLTSVKFYNKTGGESGFAFGTTLPWMVLQVNQNKRTVWQFPDGMPFDVALTIAGATGIGKSTTGAPAASTIVRGTVRE